MQKWSEMSNALWYIMYASFTGNVAKKVGNFAIDSSTQKVNVINLTKFYEFLIIQL